MVLYRCDRCNYSTKYKTHYGKHLNSKKHKTNLITNKGVENIIENDEKNDMVIEKSASTQCKPCVNPMSTLRKPNVNPMSTLCNLEINKDDNKKKKDENETIECPYCFKEFTTRQGKWKHIKKYCKEKDRNFLEKKVQNLEKHNQELIEKNKELENSKKIVNITNNTQNINSIDNSRTTNYLNITLPNMLDMDTFITNLMTTHQLSSEKTKILLESFNTCGLISYSNNLSRTLKENCFRQLRDMEKDSKGVKMLPIVTTDSNLRSYKEKTAGGWKKVDNDKRLNEIINISNDQVYKHHKEPIYLDNKDRKKVKNIIKKDHGIGELTKELEQCNFDIEKEEKESYDLEENEKKLVEEYLEYRKNQDEIEENIETNSFPIFDEESVYQNLIDCGREYIYDKQNNVFNKEKKYVGKRIHEDNCPCVGHRTENCWYYVEYI